MSVNTPVENLLVQGAELE